MTKGRKGEVGGGGGNSPVTFLPHFVIWPAALCSVVSAHGSTSTLSPSAFFFSFFLSVCVCGGGGVSVGEGCGCVCVWGGGGGLRGRWETKEISVRLFTFPPAAGTGKQNREAL